MKIIEPRKNEELYSTWAITGYPNHFFTIEACDLYNNMIARFCNNLPEGCMDLTFGQKVIRFFNIRLLNCLDIICYFGHEKIGIYIDERRTRNK